jgi:transposase
VPDELWNEIEPLLPAPPSYAKGGRHRADDRTLLDGMLHVLWTGCPWRALPREVFGLWQTVYDWFAEWKCAGVFEQVWARCLHLYDGQQGIAWEWRSADGTFVRAPWGEKAAGPNPTDRAKPGYVPLSVVSTAAKVNEGPLLWLVLTSLPIVRPQPERMQPHHLCLDAACDNAAVCRVLLVERYTGHIAPKGGRPADGVVHPGGQARRWKVERTHAWHARFRRWKREWGTDLGQSLCVPVFS